MLTASSQLVELLQGEAAIPDLLSENINPIYTGFDGD